MSYMTIIKIFFMVLIFKSCSFNDNEIVYEDKLVAFASISANLPVIDTVIVSKTASISDDNILADDLKINGADVRLIEDSTGNVLQFHNVGSGAYFPIHDQSSIEEIEKYAEFIIKPGFSYKLVIHHELDSILAETIVPEEMNIRPADLGTYVCPDGTELPTDTIDVNNLSELTVNQLLEFAMNPQQFISEYSINVDTVTFRFGDCFTKSFASYPLFGVDFDSDNYQTIKTLTFALDANVQGLEPLVSDIGEINVPTFEDPESELFYDYNYNGIKRQYIHKFNL